jgi:hypothetical protein
MAVLLVLLLLPRWKLLLSLLQVPWQQQQHTPKAPAAALAAAAMQAASTALQAAQMQPAALTVQWQPQAAPPLLLLAQATCP